MPVRCCRAGFRTIPWPFMGSPTVWKGKYCSEFRKSIEKRLQIIQVFSTSSGTMGYPLLSRSAGFLNDHSLIPKCFSSSQSQSYDLPPYTRLSVWFLTGDWLRPGAGKLAFHAERHHLERQLHLTGGHVFGA